MTACLNTLVLDKDILLGLVHRLFHLGLRSRIATTEGEFQLFPICGQFVSAVWDGSKAAAAMLTFDARIYRKHKDFSWT